MFFQGLNISLSTNFFLEVAVIFIIICNVFFFDNVLVKLCDRKEKPKMLSLLYKCRLLVLQKGHADKDMYLKSKVSSNYNSCEKMAAYTILDLYN